MSDQPSDSSGASEGDQVMIVGADGRPVGTVRMPSGERGDAVEESDGEREDLSSAVEEPAKVMRIGTMIKQLLEEVRATELDDASRRRLKEIHASSLAELESALSPELREELARIIAPFEGDDTPTDGELRIAQAQLVGWLEGLFHGIQTALVAQQMAARMQLEQMRRGLPAGAGGAGGTGGTTGQYL
ncbi:bacterial proteasome activator family protein [Actinomycetospora sp. CA-084318]|uniref:bacterial proteasome activator family protein n=1 Tax=Actinomycetospora sp. CA-084318 TaxID=3239892 RepID=UPI003D967C1F